jgi:hypothetical protein
VVGPAGQFPGDLAGAWKRPACGGGQGAWG